MDQFQQAVLANGFTPELLRKFRQNLRESQSQFWLRFGVTQSRGSRFELGTEIPVSVAILLRLYLGGVITDSDMAWPDK
jgi:predicted transcriptional regulator